MTDSAAPHVLVVSGTGVDTIVNVPELGIPLLETLHVPPIFDYVGHSGNGVAMGLHALGVSMTFVDVIGQDYHGEFIRQTYEDAGLDFQYVTHPDGTRRSVNFVSPEGERMSFHDARHPDQYTPDSSLWREQIERASHVHLTIVNWARHALSDAIYQGKSTSTDLHDWDGENDHHRDFAYGADIVFVSAVNLGDREEYVVADIFEHGRANIVIVLDGENGSRINRREEAVLEIPAVVLRGRPVIDTNGAGDAYVAAFLDEWLRSEDIEQAGHSGAMAGAWECTFAGTHSQMITRDELEEQLSVEDDGEE